MGTLVRNSFFVYIFVVIIVILNVTAIPNQSFKNGFELSVVHFNDFHARFDQTSSNAGTCKDPSTCIGGFSRLYKKITDLLNEKPKSLLLNAGDNFQGTLWYTVGKWNITQEFMNKLPIDAEVLGNHEFDDGVQGVIPYIQHLQHPIVVSNIDDSEEPTIQNLYKKSIIVERDGKKIGIVGVITSVCDTISNTGKLKFFSESASVNAEAERLVREEDVFTVIVLSHSGYDVDQDIAQNASEKISLIVGGHSHTFLYTGDNPPGPDTVGGPYPTIVQSKNGHNVLITQASAYSKYVGNITIYLDENGEIVDYTGAPIFLDTSSPQDDDINAALEPWRYIVDAQGSKVIGSTLVSLSKTGCYTSECTLGNFVTDAFVYQYTKSAPEGWWTEAPIAIFNAGGLRNTIDVGAITYSDLVTAQPFGNTVDFGQLEGRYFKDLFEKTTQEYKYGSAFSNLNLLQVSGLKVVIDLSRPDGDRVVSIKARCGNCTIPVYKNIVDSEIYNLALPSFLSGGTGDGFTALGNLTNKKVGNVDVDIFMDFLNHRSPVFQEQNGRITVYYGNKNIVTKIN